MPATIIYLDDNADCLEMFADAFADDYDVRTARSPEEARALLAERPADVIIADQHLEVSNGADFLAETARRHPTSFRILVTGALMTPPVARGINEGAINLYVCKPWPLREMRHHLRAATEGAAFYLREGGTGEAARCP